MAAAPVYLWGWAVCGTCLHHTALVTEVVGNIAGPDESLTMDVWIELIQALRQPHLEVSVPSSLSVRVIPPTHTHRRPIQLAAHPSQHFAYVEV